MKKILLLSIVILLLSPVLVTAAKDSIAVSGNETAANYTTAYWSVAQQNSTMGCDQGAWYRALINVSTNTSQNPPAKAATLTGINYTLGDEWANGTTVAYIILQNSTEEESTIYQIANATYSDGTYLKAYWNLTGKGIIVTNTSNSTWYVWYRIAPLNDKRSCTTTKTALGGTEARTNVTINCTYPGPSDLTLSNVSIVYAPSGWKTRDEIIVVRWNGTSITSYNGTHITNVPTSTSAATNTAILKNDTKTFLEILFYLPGTSGTGGKEPGGRVTRPVYIPAPTPNLLQIILSFFRAIFGLR